MEICHRLFRSTLTKPHVGLQSGRKVNFIKRRIILLYSLRMEKSMSKRRRSAARSLPSGKSDRRSDHPKELCFQSWCCLTFSQSCVENENGIDPKKGSIGFRSLGEEVSQLPSGGRRSRHDLKSPEGLKGRDSLVEALLVMRALRS